MTFEMHVLSVVESPTLQPAGKLCEYWKSTKHLLKHKLTWHILTFIRFDNALHNCMHYCQLVTIDVNIA